MIALWVALGAAVGAPARYLGDRLIQSWHETGFPFGTFTVNALAGLVLGVVTGFDTAVPVAVAALVGTGFCGALSTYSTFSFEAMRLAEDGRTRLAGGYVLASVIVVPSFAALGWSVTAALR